MRNFCKQVSVPGILHKSMVCGMIRCIGKEYTAWLSERDVFGYFWEFVAEQGRSTYGNYYTSEGCR